MSDDPFSAPKGEYEDPYANVFVRAYRGVFKRSRRRRIVATGVLVAAGLGLFGWKGAPWFVERAKKSAGACDNANYEKEPGASLSCQGSARHWLWPAKVVPWTRRAALDRELRIRLDDAETRVTLATEVFLDPVMRDQALDALLVTVADPSFPSELRRQDWVFSIAASGGGREKLVELAPNAQGTFDRQRAIRAAIALGDLQTAAGLARVADPDPYAYEYDMRRGALLCLVGDTASGMSALTSAMHRYETQVKYPYPEAQVAALLCGAPAGSQRNKLYGEQLWMAELVAAPEPGNALSHIAPLIEFDDEARTHKEPFFAVAYTGGRMKTPADVVAYAGLMTYDVGSSMTPWVAMGPLKEGFALDPTPMERAADQLDALADQLDHGTIKVEPQEEKKDYDFAKDPWHFKRDEVDKLLAHPAKGLRGAAYVLRAEAVAIYGSMLDGASAKRVVARLPDVPGATALLVANALARAGERTLARPFYEKATRGDDAGARVFAWLSLAMLELSEQRPREAVLATAKAAESLPTFDAELEKANVGWALDGSRAVGWVAAAAALAAGDATVPIPVATPDYFESTPGDMQAVPKSWFDLARADDHTRRLARFRMLDPTALVADQAVLPAMIYVLREVARDGKVPDVWLDHVLSVHDASLNGALGLRARAEAARWRGALDEAKLWDERAARLEKTLTTPRSIALATLAGVD